MTTSESKGRFFYYTTRFESLRVTNRIDSNRELECSNARPLQLRRCRRSDLFTDVRLNLTLTAQSAECGAGSMTRLSVRPSVRPSVCLSRRSCIGFAAEHPRAGDIDR